MAGAPPQTQAAAAEWVPADQTVHDRRWWILALLCTSLVIVVVGNTSLNVALPTIQRKLNASQTSLQWMVDAYSLIFAGLLLTAGAIGDRFGRKGALQGGLLFFGFSSLLAGLSHSTGGLIAFRAGMGIGAAFIMPATLSILTNVFPPHERAKAIAIWAGLSGAGAGIGPVASGYLLNHFSYGSVFFVNLPIIVLALVAGAMLIPTSKDPDQGKLDPAGAILSIIGLSALLYGIIEGPDNGWLSAETLGVFAVAAVFLGLFAAWELRVDEPMLDLRFFKNPRFSVAAGGITLVFFAMFGMFFLLTQYFQLVLGYTALGAGLRQVPVALALIAVAPNSARFVARFGPKKVVAAGMGLVGVGLLLLAVLAHIDTPYVVVMLCMIVLASGMGLTVSPLTSSIMSSIPMGKAGVGSAVNDTTRELGGALGVGVLGSLLAGVYSGKIDKVAGLSGPARELARKSLGSALYLVHGKDLPPQLTLSPEVKAALNTASRQAYVDGMHTALYVGAVFAFAAAALMIKFLPSSAPVHGLGAGSPHGVNQAATPTAAEHLDDAPVAVDA